MPESLTRETDDSNTKMDSLIRWRRQTVWELKSFGYTIDEIVQNLRPKDGIRISHGTVSRDLHAKEKQIQKEFSNYIQKLPEQNNLALTRVRRVIKEAGRIYGKDENKAAVMLPIILKATEIEQELLEKPAMVQRAIETTARLAQALKASERQTQEVLSN